MDMLGYYFFFLKLGELISAPKTWKKKIYWPELKKNLNWKIEEDLIQSLIATFFSQEYLKQLPIKE